LVYGATHQRFVAKKKYGSSYSQTGNVNNVGIYPTNDGGAIPELKEESPTKILRGKTVIRVIQMVP
jgi:hypothetical protein